MNVMVFDLESDKLKLTKLLSGNFLQLEVKAIAEGTNRNRSNFSLDSMREALPTFINKPILGYFNKHNDFESHNGVWRKDPETDVSYWDTNGDNGERILGLIRESDSISIQEDKDGKNWIVLTCALWTQYAMPQVKRLLKDRKKKVSVEIDIKEFEDIDGIRYIKKFELLGITILGSKNGKPVMEGIEGASASVFDIVNNEVFNRQKSALCFAYQQLDGDQESGKSNKEDSEKLDTELNSVQQESIAEEVIAAEECKMAEEEPESTCDCAAEAPAEVVHNDDDGDEEKSEEPEEDKDDDEDDDRQPEAPEAAYGCGENAEMIMEEQPEMAAEEIKPDCENPELLMKCNELEEANKECCERIAALEAQLAQYADYEEIKEQLAKANQALFAIDCEKRVAEARQMMDGENIAQSQVDTILAKCARGEYASSDLLKADVALAVFDTNSGSKNNKKSYFVKLDPIDNAPKKQYTGVNEKLKAYVSKN